MTRMRISALTGSTELCVFEQFCDPGTGAPTHYHGVEEVLTVLDGQAEVWVGDELVRLGDGQSVVVAAGLRHGFRNCGAATLHIQAILASGYFEAAFDDQAETRRRWG